MGELLPATTTPLGPSEVGDVFCRAWLVEQGVEPDRDVALGALGVLGVECCGGACIVQHNWGNVAAFPPWAGDFWAHPSPSPDQPAFFRAYPDHLSGARAFVRELVRRPAVLRAAARRRPEGMAVELYRRPHPYVTSGSPAVYAAGIRTWSQKFAAKGAVAGCTRADLFSPLASAAAAIAVVAIV